VHLSVLERTRRETGTPDIKASNLRDLVARTPTCHSFRHPGDLRALKFLAAMQFAECGGGDLPIQERGGVVETEHCFAIFDVVASEEIVDFF